MTAGPGATILVTPERLEGWLARFAVTHGEPIVTGDERMVVLEAADGTRAECLPPFPPLHIDPEAPDGGLLAHARLERTVGVLLVRLGGHAAGVFTGNRLSASKVGRRQVHGRNSAGGWSQQRFARRREGQVRTALSAAAEVAAGVLVPVVADLDAVVLGGDRRATDVVLQDLRLSPLRPLLVEARIEVPDPRLRVLEATPRQFSATRIRIFEAVTASG